MCVCVCVCVCVHVGLSPSSVNDKEADDVCAVLVRRWGPRESEQYCPALHATPCLREPTGSRHKQVSYTIGGEGKGEGRGGEGEGEGRGGEGRGRGGEGEEGVK